MDSANRQEGKHLARRRWHCLPAALLLCTSACAPAPRTIVLDPYFAEMSSLATSRTGPVPELPDVQAVRRAFNRPILQGCDELTCWYELSRLFRIRALTCEKRESTWPDSVDALCRYQRQLVPRKGAASPWENAETLFSRTVKGPLAGEWHVSRDRAPSE
jgi:hypothetical protein